MNKWTKEEMKLFWEELKIKAVCNIRLLAGIVCALLLFVLFGIGLYQISNKSQSDLEKTVYDYIASLSREGKMSALTQGQLEELAETVSVVLEERIAGKDTFDEAAAERIKVLVKEELQRKNDYLTEKDMELLLKDFDVFLQKDYLPYIQELRKSQEELSENLKNTKDILNQKAEAEQISRLDEVDEALKGADTELAGRLERMDAKYGAQKDSLAERVEELSKDTEDKLREAESALSEKLEQIRKKLEEGGLDTQDKLTIIMESLTEQVKTLQRNINETKKEFNTQIEQRITNINQTLEESNKKWNQSLEEYIRQAVESAALIGQDLTQLTGRVANNENAIDSISKRIDECFGLVSNGKALLASTLTDKGVITVPDASFEVINSSIAALYARAFRDGADSISGTNVNIEYEYHHHVDAGGQETHDTHNNKICDSPGGCYTLYHAHSSACYRECRIQGEYIRKYKNSVGWTVEEWECPVHGTYTHQSFHSDDHRGTVCTADVLTCGAAEGYGLSCGMVEEQILSASIKFNHPVPEAAIAVRLEEYKEENDAPEEAGGYMQGQQEGESYIKEPEYEPQEAGTENRPQPQEEETQARPLPQPPEEETETQPLAVQPETAEEGDGETE